ncbi:MAG TPA: hypothetical protein VII54_11735 [Gaiellaceae bacterium]
MFDDLVAVASGEEEDVAGGPRGSAVAQPGQALEFVNSLLQAFQPRLDLSPSRVRRFGCGKEPIDTRHRRAIATKIADRPAVSTIRVIHAQRFDYR